MTVFATGKEEQVNVSYSDIASMLEPLELPGTKGLQPVEVWTGGWSQGGDGTRNKRSTTFPAFLIRSEDDTFEVLTAWFRVLKLTKGNQPSNPHRVRFETRTVDWLLEAQWKRFGQWASFGDNDGPVPSDLLQAAFLYRHSEELGLAAWSTEARTGLSEAFIQEKHRFDKDVDLPSALRHDMANYFLQLRMADFGNPALSWKEIAAGLERFLQLFPDGEDHDRAKVLHSGVTSYVQDEAAQPVLSHDQIRGLPRDKAAVELTRRLRLQGLPQSAPGDNVVGELLKLEKLAVPALLAAVEDRRPTRQVSFMGWKAWDHEARLQSVADHAVSILMQLSGKMFENRGEAGVFASLSQKPGRLKDEIERWWNQHQSRGERRYLIDTVASGGPDICSQARELMNKYPTDAGEAITAGFAKLKSPTDRHNLIWGLDKLKDPKLISLLRNELAHGSTLECRAGAAYSLRKLGEPGTSQSMLAEWQTLLGRSHGDGTASVIQHLSSSQEISTVRELVKTLPQRPTWARVAVIEGLAGAFEKAVWNDNKPASDELKAVIEDVLASLLQDEEEQVGLSGVGYHDPSVGDQAAWRLSQIMPEEYIFDIGAGFVEKEKTRLEMLRHWHRKRGLAWELPVALARIPEGERNHIKSIRFVGSKLKGTAIEKQILALMNQPMSAEGLVSVMCDFGAHLPQGLNGLSLRLVRASEPFGVRITVWSREGRHPETWQDFTWHNGIDLEGKAISMSSGGSRLHQNIGKPDAWKEFQDHLLEALRKPTNTELVVRIGIAASVE